MNDQSISQQIQQLKTAVAENDFARLKQLRETFSIPKQVSSTNLKTILHEVLFPLLIKNYPEYIPENYDEISVYHWANTEFERILYDNCATYRRDIKESLQIALKQGKSLHEFLNRYTKTDQEPVSDHPDDVLQQVYDELKYPNIIEIPWTKSELSHHLSPYFGSLQHKMKTNPLAHLTISWNVLKKGYPLVKEVFNDWFERIEEKKLVEVDFRNNIAQAIEWDEFTYQYDLSEIGEEHFYEWLQWLDHESVLLQSTAAKMIGLTYQEDLETEEFQGEKIIPLIEMLQIIAEKHISGQYVAGGFIDGISKADFDGMYSLVKHASLKNKNFDVKNYVLHLAIHSPDDGKPYIPSAQAFWFYLHEYLDFDAQSVHTLIDHKKYWLAMMCATESLNHGSLDMMKPILERLMNEAPSDIARHSQFCLESAISRENKN